MTCVFLDIGFIPDDCESDLISVGDPDNSGTLEVLLKISEEEVKVDDLSFEWDKGIYESNSKFWKEILKAVENSFGFKRPELNAKKLGRAYVVLAGENDSDDEWVGFEVVSDESDGGEFSNEDGKFNGKYYVRYQEEFEGDFQRERVIVI